MLKSLGKWRGRRGRPRPGLEVLEDRLALSGGFHPGPWPGDAFVTAGSLEPPDQAVYLRWAQPGGLGTPITITYSYANLLDGGMHGVSPAQLKAAVQEALGRWAAVAPLDFVELPDRGPPPSSSGANYDGTGDPMIRFGHLTIDGPGNTLGYGYYPGPPQVGLAGDVDFDDSENWSVNPAAGTDFLEVCLHEIGHALGMAHELPPAAGGVNAIMNPDYVGRFHGLGTSFLYQDDINGIESLYGAGAGYVAPLSSTGGVIAPPFVVQGSTLYVNGTTGNDVFVFAPGAGSDTVTLNGIGYLVDPGTIHAIVFTGNGGTDVAQLYAGTSATLTLGPHAGTLTGSNYQVTLSGVTTVYATGGPGDVAGLLDSPAGDRLVGTPGYTFLYGPGFSNQVYGFGKVYGYATAGGTDLAHLYTGAGSNTLVGTPGYSVLSGAGYYEYVWGFRTVITSAVPGGVSVAQLYGSAGSDTLLAAPTSTVLYGPGFSQELFGFQAVYASAVPGGNDVAYLYGGYGVNTLVATPGQTYLYGGGYSNQVYGYRAVYAFAMRGSPTSAYLYDGPGGNTFYGGGNNGTLVGAGYLYSANDFAAVTILGTPGRGDHKSVGAIDYLFGALGTWL
jgi:hypothetical protein